MIILKVTENQSFNLTLENTFLKNRRGEGSKIDGNLLSMHLLINKQFSTLIF